MTYSMPPSCSRLVRRMISSGMRLPPRRTGHGAEMQSHPVDRRRLGVALLGLSWERGGETIDTPVDSSAFIDGFQHVEQPATSDRMFRWTDGNAALPPSLFPPWRGETRLYLNLKEWDGSS